LQAKIFMKSDCVIGIEQFPSVRREHTTKSKTLLSYEKSSVNVRKNSERLSIRARYTRPFAMFILAMIVAALIFLVAIAFQTWERQSSQ
ncbi:hypothetical protein PMAYCL1PPCAC_32436, partial [Pristionchus mayeri]